MTFCGVAALLMGMLSFVAAIFRAATDDYQRCHDNEMGAIGWFIVAAICLR